jgi:hypothetical protein
MTSRGWLQKIPGWEALIKEAYTLFRTYRSFDEVRKRINAKYAPLLATPLTRNNVRTILSDPVYVGRPQNLGEVVPDPSLSFIEEQEFADVQAIIKRIHDKHGPRKLDTIKALTATYGVSALEFLDKVELHHKHCGGLLHHNGTRNENGIEQEVYLCERCPAQFRIPTRGQLRRIERSQANRCEEPGEPRSGRQGLSLFHSSRTRSSQPSNVLRHRQKGTSGTLDPAQQKICDF